MPRLIITIIIALSFSSNATYASVRHGGVTLKNKTFHIYEKRHREDPLGKVYIGRTSGSKDIKKDVRSRDSNHHMSSQKYGEAKGVHSSKNKAAIRGQEQRLIDCRRTKGDNSNKINGISPKNKKREYYLKEAEKEFGKEVNCD